MTNIDRFCAVYAEKLTEAHKMYPQEYMFGSDELPKVIDRMHVAIRRFSFNLDGIAFKSTCKELGIKRTYKAIKEYFNQN